MKTPHVEVHEGEFAFDGAAAARIVSAAGRALEEHGEFRLVLAGGSTPGGVYHRLATVHRDAIDWSRTRVFWGDERAVPPDHAESNFRLADEVLLSAVGIPAARIHRVRGELPAEDAAESYDAELTKILGAEKPADLGNRAGFDLVLLGIGDDGHTASLFPGSPALEAEGWAVAALAPASAAIRDRVTLTLAALGTAREVLFLARGEGKRAAVAAVLAPSSSEQLLPAARVRPRGDLVWFLDSAAAGDVGRQ
jgi:6-phosphogluconolactonase